MKAESECGVPDERNREGPKRAQVLRTVYVRRVVERAGVIKSLTVRNLASSGAEGDCRKASVHAAAFSHLCHIEPSSGWVGYRRGEETAPCMGCRRRLPPEGGVPGSREETAPCLAARGGEAGARAGLASAGCSADAPACGQAVGANLARTILDLGRARWIRGSAERMNGKAKGLSERNTFYIYDTDERGSGSEENLRLSSLKFAYSRLSSLIRRKIVGAPRLVSRAAALGLRLAGRGRVGSE